MELEVAAASAGEAGGPLDGGGEAAAHGGEAVLYTLLYTLLYTVQVARLLAALAHPAFLDLKLRVETLLGRAQEQAEIERIKQQFIPEY